MRLVGLCLRLGILPLGTHKGHPYGIGRAVEPLGAHRGYPYRIGRAAELQRGVGVL